MVKKKFIFAGIMLFGISVNYVFASHEGDFYDNRDGDHANMSVASHDGLTYMSSGYGSQQTVVADKVVFGNASLAYTSGIYWGSLIRVNQLRSQGGMNNVYNLYVNNNAYWYPEHRDHDDIDYFFTQTPTASNSQGSSGSEIDEMHKWFYTLDAFTAETKSFLTDSNLIAPTMQMIARRTRVGSDAEYLTGVAHPNAFDNYDNTDDMVTMASSMVAEEVPPMIQISIVEEDYNITNDPATFFEPSSIPRENMHSTPVSITRVFHGHQYTKRIVVSAESSYDENSLPLTYHWAVLRGDENHITINPLNPEGSIAEILIDYHAETNVEGGAILTNLVSVGVFVNNGHYYSAPAFITSYTKRNEVRTYNSSTHKIESIVYNNNGVDPYVSVEKDWDSDTFTYNGEGELIGWTRLNGATEDKFTKEGYIIEVEDIDGNPTSVSRVYYSSSSDKVIWSRTGQPFNYPESECVSWTYTEWSPCENGERYRSITEAFPDGCVGGIPILQEACSTIRADVNQSESINTTDAQLILRNSLGLNMETTSWIASTTTGDVNCNGSSNSTDAMLTLRYSIGLSMVATDWCVN